MQISTSLFRITRTLRRLCGEGRTSCHRMLKKRDKRTEKDVGTMLGNEKQIIAAVNELKKTVLWESASIIRKVLPGLLSE